LLDAVFRICDAEDRLRAEGNAGVLIAMHETLDAWEDGHMSTSEAISVIDNLVPVSMSR